MRVIDFPFEDESAVQEAAALLIKVGKDSWPGINTALALEKARQLSCENRISLVAIDEHSKIVGLISALKSIGKLWSLLLFVCDQSCEEDVASLLKISLENRISERGGVTMQSFYEAAQKSYFIGEFLEADEDEAPQPDETERAPLIYICEPASSSVQVWLSSRDAARPVFFARLHSESINEWITRIIQERIEAEEASLVEQEQLFLKR
jgi:hypothetical protein